jgi:cytochrome c-type biogenesis protein CcmH
VAASPETAGPAVTVNVSLAESLWKQADVNHTLFVYARAAAGPPMPLAVKRLTTGDLPVTVTLDDSMAMSPAMRLSAFPEVTVGARISASGQATPQSGDLEGEVSPVRPGESGPVDVVIDSVRR